MLLEKELLKSYCPPQICVFEMSNASRIRTSDNFIVGRCLASPHCLSSASAELTLMFSLLRPTSPIRAPADV
jgi:hypothetical protein